MTNEEAIRILGRMLDEFCNEDSYAPECKDAVDMAISALEKQMPKKPEYEGWLYCPICGKDILMEGYKFCPDCGQRIDWTESEA